MPSSMIDPTKAKPGAYSTPKLKVYGDVLTLTASGISGVSENGNQPNCSTAPDRRPC